MNRYGIEIIENPENLKWVEAKDIILEALENDKAVAIESIYQPQIDPNSLTKEQLEQAVYMYGLQALQPLPVTTIYKKVGDNMYDSPQVIFGTTPKFMNDLNKTHFRDISMLDNYSDTIVDINSEIVPFDGVDSALEDFSQRAAQGEIALFNIVIIDDYANLIGDLIINSNTSRISATSSKVKHTYNLMFPGGRPAQFFSADRTKGDNWNVVYTTTKHRETWNASQLINYYLDYDHRGIMIFLQ